MCKQLSMHFLPTRIDVTPKHKVKMDNNPKHMTIFAS